MYAEFELPYGASNLKVRVPERNLSFVLNPGHVAGLPDEADAVRTALRNPLGRKPLAEGVRPGDNVVVIVTDNTRACPDDRLLPPILQELERVVSREQITIIVALGLHAPLDDGQLRKLLGDDIVSQYRVVNHDPSSVVNIGVTSRGTPVDINPLVVNADFRVSTGFIEPHFFAGFSGGRKSIAPGVFGLNSAYVNHGYSMIEHPLARAGVLKGNPIHEDMVEQARMAKLDFVVNVLLNGRKEITHVFAGDLVIAHEAGCEVARTSVGRRVAHRVDITITTNSGAPLDLDLYQTVKGMDGASLVTRDGGVVIVASSCSDGVGPQSFVDLHQSCAGPIDVLQKIRREEPVGVQWQNQILARIQMRNHVMLHSELDDALVRSMQLEPVHDLSEAVAVALQRLGPKAEIGVIPEGPLVLPLLQS
ncbi:MAG: nickel-dependent lactate racemase [Dehalococcoidia bacterium]|nr:nickel-dependent lactate racemase [Dehalococcoidia bacterium]